MHDGRFSFHVTFDKTEKEMVEVVEELPKKSVAQKK